MRRHLILAFVVLAASAAVAGAEHVRLDYSRPAEGINKVVLEAGVGDVEILGDGGTTITARVDVTPKTGHFWSHHDEDLTGLQVETEVHQGTLFLRVGRDRHEDHSWGEDWTVHLPQRMAVKVELGVGDTKVLDVAGDIAVEVGVGDVSVEGQYASFGDVHASSGVGDASLRTPQAREDGEGFIGHSLRSHGPGVSEIHISAGVGDTEIRLR
jgi:hypothetical protein